MTGPGIIDSPTPTMTGDDADLNRIAPMSDDHEPPTDDPDTAADTAADEAIADVEGQLSALFNRVRSNWRDYAASVHPELQPAGYKILGHLVRQGPAHAGVLAEQLHTDKSVISRQVRLMEQLGLVESTADASDGRARVLVATPLAVEKVTAIRRTNQAKFYELLRTWPEDDIRKFAELLGRLSI